MTYPSEGEIVPWGTRTKAFKDYDDSQLPYLVAGALFQVQEYKNYNVVDNPVNRTPGERFRDHLTGTFTNPGDVLMFLSYVGYGAEEHPSLHLPQNKFWNLTQNKLMILRGYHWWFEDNLDRLSEV